MDGGGACAPRQRHSQGARGRRRKRSWLKKVVKEARDTTSGTIRKLQDRVNAIRRRFRVAQFWVTDHQRWQLASVQHTSLPV